MSNPDDSRSELWEGDPPQPSLVPVGVPAVDALQSAIIAEKAYARWYEDGGEMDSAAEAKIPAGQPELANRPRSMAMPAPAAGGAGPGSEHPHLHQPQKPELRDAWKWHGLGSDLSRLPQPSLFQPAPAGGLPAADSFQRLRCERAPLASRMG